MDAVRTLEALEPLDVGASRERPPVDTSIFLGSWTSTNRDTQGLARLLVRREGGDLVVRAFGACALSLYDWGEVRATVFADGPDSTQGHAFIARFDLGFKETSLQAKVKKGVLVVANFNRFKDGSGRAHFFSREFFYRLPEHARDQDAARRP